MKNIKKGTKVLIEATIIGRCMDDREPKDCGFRVSTSRGTVMVEPHEIRYVKL